jgi:FMN reductase
VTDVLTRKGCSTRHLKVRDLPPRALLLAEADDPLIWTAADAVAQADGVVLITPIYRAAYAGLLKAFLDVLPRESLAGKTVLPLATGGSHAHVLALDYSLHPVVHAMGATHVVRGYFVHDEELPRRRGQLVPQPEALQKVRSAVATFHAALPWPGDQERSPWASNSPAAELPPGSRRDRAPVRRRAAVVVSSYFSWK